MNKHAEVNDHSQDNPHTPADSLVRVENVSMAFAGRSVINNVSFAVNPGEITTLIGPNGSGKSTLVRLLLGLLQPDSGQVHRQQRLSIGYMPQKLHIEPTMPLSVGRFMCLGVKASEHAVRQVLSDVRAEHLLHSPMQSLSGGESQRVLMARALLRKPRLLVLDEPVQGVDVNGQVELYALIAQIRDRYRCAVFMVSHDLHLVMSSTDRVICLNNHICCSGHPEQVSNDPAFIALFGSKAADQLALYSHKHNHQHDDHGNVITDHPCQEGHQHG